ncbi:alanine--tRNA ligase, cytoplasmic-like [Haliotis cracherodii]|uniref:alanine--tRNA ligase, cytoplasmic-like n=1 Tax=Haliotis cracherodii TaxID=6455 RepID=UPI0039E7BB4C
MYLRILFRLHISSPRLHPSWRYSSSWSSSNVRSAFISYFKDNHDHIHVPSSSVVPNKKQGTYFTNAGMMQFKPLFLGAVQPGSRLEGLHRAVNSQKCIRVGGKHNDLEDVGHDLTHHTFFEMLGSWSFGDYFKQESCQMALELLTQVYNLPLDRLYFTYFGGDELLGLAPDVECRDIWLALGVPANRVLPFGMKDNFWDMGETGPCGPCTEIHFDHVGSRTSSHLVNADSPEVVEIWNLVFMQYNRKHDRSLELLPRQHVDTGMGLERMTAVLQGSRSNYDTDLFQPLFRRIHKVTGAPAYQGLTGASDHHRIDQAYRILADHARMMSVAIADGLLPGRDGLQHKLRLIIHRAISELEVTFGTAETESGNMLGDLSQDVVESLGETYPELARKSTKIREVLQLAADQYHQLQKKIKAKKIHQSSSSNQTQLEKSDGFYRRGFKCEAGMVQAELFLPKLADLQEKGVARTDDTYKYTVYARTSEGHDFSCQEVEGRVVGIVTGAELCGCVPAGHVCGVVLDRTCFYSESGGQAADTGHLRTQDGLLEVLDVQVHAGYVVHVCVVVEGEVVLGQSVQMELDQVRRVGHMCSHTGTHLLNAVLRAVLQETKQLGSDVQDNKFSFDFASVGTVSPEQTAAIENLVQQHIVEGHSVSRLQMELNVAMAMEDLTMMEDEDYPSPVQVIRIGGESSPLTSLELCGGTHVSNTSDLDGFCVVNLKGVAQGTKRATCVTGQVARQAIEKGQELESGLSQLVSEVKSGENMDAWTEKVKDINTSLSQDLLPKLVRDRVREQLDVTVSRIRTEQNKLQQASLQQMVLGLASNSSEDIMIQHFTFDGKLMMKALSAIEISKPVVLVSDGERTSYALIAAPQSMAGICKSLFTSCQDELGASTVTQSKAKCGQDKVAILLTLKGRATAEKLYTVLRDIVESGSR